MIKRLFWLLVVPALLLGAYFAVVMRWNYSTGERAGWVQKLSKKGWLCKTWEGEMAMVSMPGATPEKFPFTVWDDAVADNINKVIGRRVSLHYEEKVGLPTSCFGETRHYVTHVTAVEEIPLAPGVVVPIPRAPATEGKSPSEPAQPGVPAQQPAPGAPPAQQTPPAQQSPSATPPAVQQTPSATPPPAQQMPPATPPPAQQTLPAAPPQPPPAAK